MLQRRCSSLPPWQESQFCIEFQVTICGNLVFCTNYGDPMMIVFQKLTPCGFSLDCASRINPF